MTRKYPVFIKIALFALPVCLALAMIAWPMIDSMQAAQAEGNINLAFDRASQEFGVPSPLLKALCYMEGHLSNHGGTSSIDGGYGCMHLVKNNSHASVSRDAGGNIGTDMVNDGQTDDLDKAAKDLGVAADQLKMDMATNIRGGAVVLRDDALQLSSNHTLPTSLADWYASVALYSNASTQSTAHMYADAVYKLINDGFSGTTDTGEAVTLAPEQVLPNKTVAINLKTTPSLPKGCVNDGQTEFPGAINCIIDPAVFDCTPLPDGTDIPCTYNSAKRPEDLAINSIGIHDIEGTAQDGVRAFQNVKSGVSIHYVVDSDGTVFQILHEKDIAFHIGNLWYNQHSIGIEHAGFAATGFLWYNAAQYLGSAKLVAYLTAKYHIPVDHDHIVSHGTVPSPKLAVSPNHVDPGPYWLWDFYLKLIKGQDPETADKGSNAHIISIHPNTGKKPLGPKGTETAANFNFFYLYNGPSTKSGLILPKAAATDVTDETVNVETAISYYAIAQEKDQAGTGDTMYEIWYGAEPNLGNSPPDKAAHAILGWLAVPSGASQINSNGTAVSLITSGSTVSKVYGKPVNASSDENVIGDAPNNSIFVSMFTVIEDGTNNLWYEINYNHRQAWIPAEEITEAPPQNT